MAMGLVFHEHNFREVQIYLHMRPGSMSFANIISRELGLPC